MHSSAEVTPPLERAAPRPRRLYAVVAACAVVVYLGGLWNRFAVDDLPAALAQVEELGGSIVHPGELWAICKDTEGSPFGLAARH